MARFTSTPHPDQLTVDHAGRDADVERACSWAEAFITTLEAGIAARMVRQS
jgi:hypothetical protein